MSSFLCFTGSFANHLKFAASSLPSQHPCNCVFTNPCPEHRPCSSLPGKHPLILLVLAQTVLRSDPICATFQFYDFCANHLTAGTFDFPICTVRIVISSLQGLLWTLLFLLPKINCLPLAAMPWFCLASWPPSTSV